MRSFEARKSSFAAGQYDMPMMARSDVAGFESAAFELKNVFGLPRGGVDQRGGLERVSSLPVTGGAVKMFPFKFNQEQKYIIVFTALKAFVFHDGAKTAEVDTPYAAADVPELDAVQSLDTMIITSGKHPPARLMRKGAHDSWEYAALTITGAPQYTFDQTAEAAWSDARGWPKTCHFHEGRLYFGGTESLPNTIWGSKTNSPFDFTKTTSLLDDEGVEATLEGGRAVAHIRSVASNQGLFIFTTEGPYALTKSPVTPKTFMPQRYGAQPAGKIRNVEMDGAILFLTTKDGGMKPAVNEFVWNDDQGRFEANDLNIRCYDIINAPVDCACRQGNTTDAANHLFVVNGDGTAAVLNLKRSQSMVGWSYFDTGGRFIAVAVNDADVYFVVERDGAYWLERLNGNRLTDGSTVLSQETETTQWSVAGYAGKTAAVIADGTPLGRFDVADDGSFELPFAAKEIEIGYPFEVRIVPMPPAFDGGPDLTAFRWCITRLSLLLERSFGCRLNGRECIAPKFGTDVFNAKIQYVTGWKTVLLSGWVDAGTQRPVVISTSSELRLTLHALVMEIVV
nr:MAG TPA: stabilization protein [Caudoviricetes sp.]